MPKGKPALVKFVYFARAGLCNTGPSEKTRRSSFNYANISIKTKAIIVPIFNPIPAIDVFFFSDFKPKNPNTKPKGTVINGPNIVNIPKDAKSN